MKMHIFLLVGVMLLSVACKKRNTDFSNGKNQNSTMNDWLIPISHIFDGGPGKDGIPALENPPFVEANKATYLHDDDLVLGYVYKGNARAYPHLILNWHEIINDDINELSIAIIYCPLTGTGIGWNREVGDEKTTFGVSGLLYNSNIIPYDRETGSNWSQMLLKSINGSRSGLLSANYNLIETSWKTWKLMYPNTKVVSSNIGYSRNYGSYPYGDYRTSDFLLFPVNNYDDRLPNKERVLGILLSGRSKAYSIEDFSDTISIISDVVDNELLVITGSKEKNFIVAYKRELDGTVLSFTPVQNALPVIMKDNEGSRWDVLGNAVSGPRMGKKLKSVTQFMGYWFAWAAFYPEVELYGDANLLSF